MDETFLFDDPRYQSAESLKHCVKDKSAAVSDFEHMADRILRRESARRRAVIERIAEIGLPEPGEQIRLVTMRNFTAIEILQYIAGSQVITDCVIVLYSLSRANAAKLRDMVVKGKIKRALFLVSALRNTAAVQKEESVTRILAGTPGVELFFASSHAKIVTCATDKGNFYTLEGSGNLASNSRIEQYCFDNDEALYRFHCDWIAKVRSQKGSEEYEMNI